VFGSHCRNRDYWVITGESNAQACRESIEVGTNKDRKITTMDKTSNETEYLF
jgi:hypothetical protein